MKIVSENQEIILKNKDIADLIDRSGLLFAEGLKMTLISYYVATKNVELDVFMKNLNLLVENAVRIYEQNMYFEDENCLVLDSDSLEMVNVYLNQCD